MERRQCACAPMGGGGSEAGGRFFREISLGAGRLKQVEEFLDGQPRVANKRTRRADRKFLVLRDGKVHTQPGLRHHDVAANLADAAPAVLLECSYRFAARDVCRPSHSLTR